MSVSDNVQAQLSILFEQQFGVHPATVTALPASGGDRRYYRLATDEVSAIGVYGENVTENRRFLYLAKVLGEAGVSVPQIYGVGLDECYYLQQDLGSRSLFDAISDADETERQRLVVKCMSALAGLQLTPIDYTLLYEPFGRRMVLRDLNYFRYCMLKPSGVDPDEDKIDQDFYALADRLADVPEEYIGFMYRDCQSRNVMLVDNEPYWIDFQGGRRGPVLYDVASFLWQARAGFSAATRKAGADAYINAYCAVRTGANPERMRQDLPMFVLLRLMQVLGAYGFRGLIEHRAHFILSIGPAIENVASLLDDGVCDDYPELKRCIESLVRIWQNRLKPLDKVEVDKKLTVKIFSFSYKKGYPADYTGNGGGFMFDCRGMHNPGRYEQYKRLTGRDKPVIDFLEERGEVQSFVRNAEQLVAPTVERYIQRGFDSLQIGFGCTGGQHRSVYCAEVLAKMLHAKYPEIRVELEHREQGVREVIS